MHWSSEEKGQCKGCITFTSTNILHHVSTMLPERMLEKSMDGSKSKLLERGLSFPTLLNTLNI